MATFMAAAYAEHRFGRPAYDHEVASWRASLDRVRREGGDKPLVFPDWNRPSRNDRTLVYDKGALVFHLLRERVGEAAFWAAIRTFTRSQAGRSVTTRDLEQAFGPAAGDIFATWVAPSRP
jgi:aminopeptidase N